MKKNILEKGVETFATGAGVNLVLGGVGAVIIQFLFGLPELWKTVMFWLGGGLIVVAVGYLIQRHYAGKRFSIPILLGGIALGLFLMIVVTPWLAKSMFPWLPAAAGLAGPGIYTPYPDMNIMLPAMLGALICLVGMAILVIKRH